MRNRARYAVRAYDTERGRLMPDPVVDPREPDEPMQGFPLTRVTGESGRWEYTLYGGGRGHPFIHALDTVARESICIDLPHRIARHRRLFELKLELRGGQVRVVDRGKLVASASRAGTREAPGGQRSMGLRSRGSRAAARDAGSATPQPRLAPSA